MATQLTSEPKKELAIRTGNAIELRATLQAQSHVVFAAMPKHMTPERMISICVRCFRKTPKLASCAPLSILDSISQAAALGLEPDGVLGHAYLVPYKNECVLIPGYKGLIDLCRRSGNVSEVHLECVCEGDEFSYSKGLNPTLVHVPDDSNPQDDDTAVTHAYVVFRLRDGGKQFDVWPRARIDGHKEKFSQGWRWAESGDRARGGGKKDSPWHTNWREMAMKTVLRNMIARGKVPVSAEIQRLAAQDELVERDYTPPSQHQSRVAVSTLNSFADSPDHAEDASKVEPDDKPHVSPETKSSKRRGYKPEPGSDEEQFEAEHPPGQMFDNHAQSE